MQSLLLDRATTRLSPLEFAATYTESLYSSLRQIHNGFPANCHANAAVNSLSIEKSEYRYLLSGCADSSIKLWDFSPEEGGGNDQTTDGGSNPGNAVDNDNSHDNSHNDHSHNDNPHNGDIDTAGYPLHWTQPEPQLLATIPKRSEHQYGVSAVHWWPHDTGIFLTASFDHTVKVWDTNNLAVAHTFDMGSRVYAVGVSTHSDNQYSAQALVAVASDQPFVRLLDLRSASSAHTLEGHKGKTLAVAWHLQNPYLLASGGYDGEAKVWDIRRSRSCVCRLDMTKTNARDAKVDALNLGATSVKAHSGPVNALTWDETGQTLYTSGNDDRIRVWDMAATHAPPVNRLVNFGPLTRNKYLQNLPIVLSPRHETEVQHLLFASDSGDVLVFRALDGKLVTRLARSGSKSNVRTASIVYGGPWSATYYCGTMDGEILTWKGLPYDPEDEMVSDDDEDEAPKQEAKISKDELYNDPYFRRKEGVAQ